MPVIEISDFSAEELNIYAALTEAQLRNRLEPEKGIFIAESPKVIDVALRAGCQPLSLLMGRRHLEQQGKELILRCTQKEDIPIYTAEDDLLEKLTGYRLTRGILCAMRRPKLPAVEEICTNARRIAVLENIVDSTNIGAIFRSAAALGMDAVLLTPSCCDPLCRRAVRVSMGTVFLIPWTYIGEQSSDWPQAGMERLRCMGFRTAAMALCENTLSIADECLAQENRLAIILGTEGDGLANHTIASCDYTVKIPMAYGVDSLNVAAAGAVAFWQLAIRKE